MDYQAPDFVVTELGGHTLAEFVAVGGAAGAFSPEVLLMRTETGEWHRCFLDAFIGFWDGLSEDQAAEVIQDYADAPRVDMLAKYGLGGQSVLGAQCERSAEQGARISIVFESGAVVLREADPSDPDSVSVLAFVPK